MIVFPIHHKTPKHWALGVVRTSASTASFLHYDSMPSEERYANACDHFNEWLDGCDVGHEVTFYNLVRLPYRLTTCILMVAFLEVRPTE
jgi:hypothetical protein